MTARDPNRLIIAVPKGRLLDELIPMLDQAGIKPEAAFRHGQSRKLCFATEDSGVELVQVRSFDVATLVAFGAAQIGIAGLDVIAEHEYPEIFSPVDLKIGKCRLSLARLESTTIPVEHLAGRGEVHIATKYPNTTRRYFHARGIQLRCVKLHGALELAPLLGLCDLIVDLVSTGATLRANKLIEVQVIAHSSARLIVNRNAARAQPDLINGWIERFCNLAQIGEHYIRA
ncbi:MAG: ATP phosphoribosyltransferase [Pseudomonadota bacterium]